jgi:hypothetical protein
LLYVQGFQNFYALLHDFQDLGDGKLGIGLAAHFFNLDAGGEFRQGELASGSVNLEDTLRAVSCVQIHGIFKDFNVPDQ